MSAIELDKDILATMDPEEVALLTSDEWKEDQDAAATKPDGADDNETPDDDKQDEATGAAGAADADPEDSSQSTPTAPAADTTPAATPAPEVEVAQPAKSPSPAPERKPVYRAALPPDYDDQVKALAVEDEALADKYKAGEIEFDEFRIQSAALNDRRHDLSAARVKAEISSEITAQTTENEWVSTVNAFMANVKTAEGVDYLGKDPSDAKKNKDLDMFVKALASDDDNADKPMGWFLDEAHRMVKAKHGIAAKEPAQIGNAEKPTRPSPIGQAPKNLASVPGTDGPGDIGGDEFQELDRLDGLELEEAIAKLSPAAREKYLQGV